jgi:hypothetical protein
MRVITDEEAKINELFVRLNRSKPLTGAEIRNAMGGVVPGLIRDLCQHPFFVDRTRFSTNRRQDQNAAAKLLLMEFRGHPVGTQKPGIDRLVQDGIRAEADAGEFRRAVNRCKGVLDRMALIFSSKDPLLSSAGPLTVYYWLVREIPKEVDSRVRQFLVEFNKHLAGNRARAQAGKSKVDPDLVLYSQLARSVDNQGSIEGRYEILRRRLT